MDAADYINSGQIYCEPLAITMQSWAGHERRGVILSLTLENLSGEIYKGLQRGAGGLCPIPTGLLGLELESQSSATPG